MPDPNENQSTLRVIYSGNVQGVGFRWTCRQIATSFPVVGHVRNLANGTVELIVRGTTEAVYGFLRDVNRQFHQNISDRTEESATLNESITSFEIRK